MAEKIRYILQKPARLIFSSITEKSAPRNVANAKPKFGATFGVEQEDFKAICELMVTAIKNELGSFSQPSDYYLPCQSGEVAANRALAKAKLDAAGKSSDEAFKIQEKAESRAKMYREYGGILQASSQFDIGLSKLDGGSIVDITEPHAIIAAGKDLFYPGAYVVPCVEFQAYRRKNLDAKDGATGFLKQVLFIRKGQRLGGGPVSGSSVFGKDYSGYSDYDPTAMAPSLEDDIPF